MAELEQVRELLSSCKAALYLLLRSHNDGELTDVGPVMEAVINIVDELDAGPDVDAPIGRW